MHSDIVSIFPVGARRSGGVFRFYLYEIAGVSNPFLVYEHPDGYRVRADLDGLRPPTWVGGPDPDQVAREVAAEVAAACGTLQCAECLDCDGPTVVVGVSPLDQPIYCRYCVGLQYVAGTCLRCRAVVLTEYPLRWPRESNRACRCGETAFRATP